MRVLTLILMGTKEAVAIHDVHSNITQAYATSEHDVVYLHGEEGHESLYPPDATIKYLGLPKRVVTKSHKIRYFFRTKFLKKQLAKLVLKYEIIITDGLLLTSLISKYISERQRVITIIHGVVKDLRKISTQHLGKMKEYNFYYVGVSKTVSNSLLSFGFNTEQIKAIVNGIDLEAHKSSLCSREDARAILKLSQTSFVIGSVGRLVNAKQFSVLINSFADYLKINSKACLVIVGDGPLRENIESQIKKLQIEGNVILTGYLECANRYLKAFDVFAMASSAEGLGIAVLEALATGLPVVLSDIPTFREIQSYAGQNSVKIAEENDFAKEINLLYNTSIESSDLEAFCQKKMRIKYKALIQDVIKGLED